MRSDEFAVAVKIDQKLSRMESFNLAAAAAVRSAVDNEAGADPLKCEVTNSSIRFGQPSNLNRRRSPTEKEPSFGSETNIGCKQMKWQPPLPLLPPPPPPLLSS
ncbi:Hypothetical predicted protein [Paramuricea clavata]|uniref:Uncharacterized protein n=1 Tax=Paramuricea clavata TaxID=317549 RepID=A0A7D9MD92_PARCT|nr:Hypothetical predicted protein [Paramuricea clavata]